MYSSFNDLIKKLEANSSETIQFSKRDGRLGLGILLYRVILVDGRVKQEEIELFRNIVEEHLKISEDEMQNFEESAKEFATSPKLLCLKSSPDAG